MESDIQADTLHAWGTKDKIEQRLLVGMHGTPELKHSEKIQYLGEFRERIIKCLTKKQAAQTFIYSEIEDALKHPQAEKMLIDGELSPQFTDKYIQLARQIGKPYTLIHDPELKGETGVVVVSKDAVDVDDIEINDR
ncbi:YueI family protein [Desulfosporosinus sp. FKA]|uniref:YueI family protein n=1 Tax=Desulfosporosinus sp. FKA TaxID=1969834 RepID=UPI000B4A4077|nr:YueI family protein [Desulfosporosinus sp. FKA]